MKKTILTSIFTALIGFFAISSYAKFEERVVATVDGFPILESQVKSVMGKNGNYNKALDRIIDDVLVQRAVQESGVQVNPAYVEHIIEDIAAQNNLTYGQLLDALEYQGKSIQQFRQEIAHQVLMSEVRNQTIGKSVDITRDEVESLGQQLIDDAKAKGKTPVVMEKQYKVRHILLKLTPMLDDAEAKAELSQIRADILAGKISFADAALKYSKDYLSGANGGVLDYAFPASYVQPFANVIMKSKKGVISEPFKTEYGWHIVEVLDTREADATEEAYRQKAYQQIVHDQLKDAEKDWIKALRKKAHIEYINK